MVFGSAIYTLSNSAGPIPLPTGSVAEELGWDSTAVLTQGFAVDSMTQALDAIRRSDGSFQHIMFDRQLTPTEVDDLADWVNGTAYVAWVELQDEAGVALVSNESTSNVALASATEENNLIGVWTQQVDEYKAANAAGGFAGVNYDGIRTSRTMKYLQAPGATPDQIETLVQKAELDRKRVNYHSQWADLAFFAEGVTFGPNVYAGTLIWLQWLKNTWETRLVNLMAGSGSKIPKTPEGRALVRQVSIEVLERGVRNGGIARGGAFSEEMAADIRAIAGETAIRADNTTAAGYVLWLARTYSEDRPRKQDGRVWLVGSEAIHNIEFAGNLIEGANPLTLFASADAA